jgi:hypothetical protein
MGVDESFFNKVVQDRFNAGKAFKALSVFHPGSSWYVTGIKSREDGRMGWVWHPAKRRDIAVRAIKQKRKGSLMT